jgi:hypothetical protein
MISMQAPPWGCPPVWADGDVGEGTAHAAEQVKAKALAERMRAAGLSIYEPDPIKALEEVAQSKQRALHVVGSEQEMADSPDDGA